MATVGIYTAQIPFWSKLVKAFFFVFFSVCRPMDCMQVSIRSFLAIGVYIDSYHSQTCDKFKRRNSCNAEYK